MNPPIPAFYCCYLLRSIKAPAKFYVGSTPNAARRLKQHNGGADGGAKGTHKARPWEMACMVSGFPSRMAALHFEWAWRNPHVTRHIADAERITQPKKREVVRNNRSKVKVARPATSLRAEIGNLHLLLRAPNFARWPLQVRFFNTKVFDFWQKWDAQATGKLRKGIIVRLDESCTVEDGKPGQRDKNAAIEAAADANAKRINALDFTYTPLKETLLHSEALFAAGLKHECGLCRQDVSSATDLPVACTAQTCDMVAHLTCLAQYFVARDPNPNAILPTEGTCPACKTDLSWSHLVSDLSLRLRGQDVIRKLMKVKKSKKSSDFNAAGGISLQADTGCEHEGAMLIESDSEFGVCEDDDNDDNDDDDKWDLR